MPFQRPTIDQLIERVKSDFRTVLGITNILRRSFLGAMAKAIAGMSHLQLGYMDWISKQVMPDTAEDEWLIRWTTIFDIQQTPATFAEFKISITGGPNAIVDESDLWQGPSGIQHKLKAEVTLDGSGAGVGQVVAQNEGKAANLDVGAKISLLSPVANINSDATVSEIVIIAADEETLESLRERLLNRLRLPPLGGSANDYVTWAKEVAGVTRS